MEVAPADSAPAVKGTASDGEKAVNVAVDPKSALLVSSADMEELLRKALDHVQTLAPPREDMHALFTDFHSFVERGNVVDLAIGMILGSSFTAILNSLVVDILTPILSIFSARSLANYYVVARCPPNSPDCSSATWATTTEARAAGAVTLNLGLFVENVLNFFVNALFLYLVVKKAMQVAARLNSMMKEATKKAEPPLATQTSVAKVCPTEAT